MLVGAPSWWLSPTQRSLPRPGGGRPRLRWTRAFDWAVSRREPFQGFWVSVELVRVADPKSGLALAPPRSEVSSSRALIGSKCNIYIAISGTGSWFPHKKLLPRAMFSIMQRRLGVCAQAVSYKTT